MKEFKIYCAGLYHSGAYACDYRWGLESYFYLRKSAKILDWTLQHPEPIFLDSGAYSAFTKQIPLSVDDYCNFIWDHHGKFEPIAALDVIGDAEASRANYDRMRHAWELPGVVPCFHFGEPYVFLEAMIACTDYIAIGGVAQVGTGPKLIEWLDYLWANYLTNKDGTPKVRVHGFAITNTQCLFRYPWFSVDSTSWVLASRNGLIIIDQPMPDGSIRDRKVAISSRSPSQETKDRHYDSLNPAAQRVLREYIESLGYDVAQLRDDHKLRDHFNSKYYERVSSRGAETFIRKQAGLF